MPRPRVILDCDPGHDDVLAIATAARYAELLAITTVSGNAPLDKTTRNALVTLQVAGIDVPVHSGAAGPLAGPAVHAELVHGETGLDGVDLAEVERTVAGRDGVGFLVEAARSVPDLWIVATGPLTNVATAMQRAPDLARQVAGISIMGGGTFGNVTPVAEFNIYADPEAADVVFRSGARLLMCGLDLTHQVRADAAFVGRLRALGTAFGDFTGALVGHYRDRIHSLTGRDFAALHDPCAVLALTHPELFEIETRPVSVELTGTHTRGMTVIDTRSWVGGGNCGVATRIDAPRALDLVVSAIALLS